MRTPLERWRGGWGAYLLVMVAAAADLGASCTSGTGGPNGSTGGAKGGSGGAAAGTGGATGGGLPAGAAAGGGAGATAGVGGVLRGGTGLPAGAAAGGGAGAIGGAGGGLQGCTRVGECTPPDPSRMMAACVPPYGPLPTSPPATGGAPAGNGIPVPSGAGLPCQTTSDCATFRTGAGGSGPSLACSNGTCRQCTTDMDCPKSTPVCFTSHFHVAVSLCAECRQDAECPAGRPFCIRGVEDAGLCNACQVDSDCAEGYCFNHACSGGCSPEHDVCPDPAAPCSAHHRCEAKSCSGDADCPPFTTCSSGFCRHKSCSTPEQCPNGFCVEQGCYAVPGFCYSFNVYE